MIVTLTTDFGASEYVAAMKGVLLGMDSTIRIVDVRHDIAPGNIAEGAFALYTTAPHFPFAVHVGVVDPGVGTNRRGLAVICEGAIFVGRFGNVVTNVPGKRAEERWSFGATIRIQAHRHEFSAPFLRTYGMAGKGSLLLTIGSHGFLEIAANGGSAAQLTGLRMWDALTLGKT